MNSITIVGNLTRDPEITLVGEKRTPKASLSVAVNRSRNREQTDFFNVEVWGKTAEFAEKYFSKGKSIGVRGEMQCDTWEKDGERKSRWYINASDIEFVGKATGGNTNAYAPADMAATASEELPF